MNKDLQERLFEKYPVLFKRRSLPASETCMCWGISIPNGLYNLFESMCEEITKNYPDAQFEQVKMKFGLLRCYFHTHPDVMKLNEISMKYESMSCYLCWECGKKVKDIKEIKEGIGVPHMCSDCKLIKKLTE